MRKKLGIVFAIACAMLVIAATASALGLYDAAFWKAWDGATYYNYGMVHFYGGTTATGAYNTVPGRVIKQAYVRLVEGSYDSGRCYTAVGPYTPNWVDYKRTIRKTYNPLAVCYGYYGWLYY
jgi:hypothetical protein